MLQQALKQASAAAVALGKDSHAKKISAFIQSKAPFTETYSTQSGEIFGILADMRDTFESDLETATTKENKSEEMYQAIKTVLEEEHLTMGNQLQAAQGQLSDNDQELGTKKNQKQSDEDEKAEAEKFLSDLKEMCAEKASQYEKRVKLRSSEETALSQAIAILNSDMAFEAFGKVSATSFLQIGRRNVNVGKGKLVVESVAKRRRVDSMLRKAAQSQHSLKVARIASMVEAENPFTEVLEAITSMLAVIEAEGDNDQKNKEWCVDERKEKKAALKKAEEDITALKSAIVTLEGTIDSLKTDIQNTEEELAVNEESQTSQTAQRKEENLDYQSNVANLVEASELLKKAIVVLKDYYEDAMLANQQGTGFVQQKSGQSPTPPKTWDDAYVGQSEGTGGGKDAVSMLEFILKNTQTEESVAHEQENESQQRYEKEMQGLKEDEATLQSTLAKKQEDLAKSEEELLGKQKDLKTMEELAAKIEAYLLKIKPGCDFIEQNIAIRDRNRKDESDALKDARDMIMDTPVFKEAMATAKNETLGDCAGTCAADEDDVACKACVSKVSIPGYCAGHPGTKGCP
jgi:chromosome segregation ATPase